MQNSVLLMSFFFPIAIGYVSAMAAPEVCVERRDHQRQMEINMSSLLQAGLKSTLVRSASAADMQVHAQQAGGKLTTGSFNIDHCSLSRPVHVNVPDGDGPFPIIITLHGNGGNGYSFLNGLTRNLQWDVLKASHVFAAPDGDEKSWNIVTEASDCEDVGFIEMIIDYLASKSNVNANQVQLYGSSNGAALINRIFIESTDARIVRGVTEVSQLNERQYRSGNFYIGGSDNTYTQVQPSLLHREILALQGGQDNLIPPCACESPMGFSMNSDQDSIYAYAVAYGYTGAKLEASDHPTYYSFSYLDGAVSSYTVKEAGHSVSGRDTTVDDVVINFLQRGDGSIGPTLAPTPSPPSPPTKPPVPAPQPKPSPRPPTSQSSFFTKSS